MQQEKDNAQVIRRWFEEVWNKGRMDAIAGDVPPERHWPWASTAQG